MNTVRKAPNEHSNEIGKDCVPIVLLCDPLLLFPSRVGSLVGRGEQKERAAAGSPAGHSRRLAAGLLGGGPSFGRRHPALGGHLNRVQTSGRGCEGKRRKRGEILQAVPAVHALNCIFSPSSRASGPDWAAATRAACVGGFANRRPSWPRPPAPGFPSSSRATTTNSAAPRSTGGAAPWPRSRPSSTRTTPETTTTTADPVAPAPSVPSRPIRRASRRRSGCWRGA